MKKYIGYEEGSNGTFTEKEMQTLYTEQVNKEEYSDYESWLYDMLKSGVFEEVKENLTIISGTFKEGCGITVKNEKWNIYNLLVVADKKTKKPCVELHEKVYFEEDISNKRDISRIVRRQM